MFHFLLILNAIFAICIADDTIIQKLETIKVKLDNEEKVFLSELPKAEAASSQKYAELAKKFKQFEEQCKTLDTVMRIPTEFDLPELLTELNPWKKFHMDDYYKEKTICEDFLKLDPHVRFEHDSRLNQLAQLRYELDNIERTTSGFKLEYVEKTIYMDSEEMKMLSGLKTNSIQLLIEHYNKIGKVVVDIEKALEKLQNGNKAEKLFVKKVSLKKQCEALKKLIGEKFNLPNKVELSEHFNNINVLSQCNDLLQTTEKSGQKAEKIEDFKKLLQNIKEMVGSVNHPTETRKLLEEAQKDLNMETVDNLIQTYQSIGKANTDVKNSLQECENLYYHNDMRAPIQIKYFVELTKIGQEFAENLRKYFISGQPLAQKPALKKEKDEFGKKLTSDIVYNGGKRGGGGSNFFCYAYVYQPEYVFGNLKYIYDRVEQYSIVPDILSSEKETILKALTLLEIYKLKISAFEKNS